MQSTSSRKGQTSITHLMNFTLPPRPQFHQQSHVNRNARKNPSWGVGSGYHAIDKAKYACYSRPVGSADKLQDMFMPTIDLLLIQKETIMPKPSMQMCI